MRGSFACWAVIPAAGIGRRMRSQTPKQYLPLGDRLVIEHSLAPFIDHSKIAGVVVAIDARDKLWPSLKIVSAKPVITVTGGPERAHSVLNALRRLIATAQAHDWVLVHDAVRPCLARHDLDALITGLGNDSVGGILAAPVRDTLKRGDSDHRIDETVDRTGLWHALTPQMFRLEVLLAALEDAIANGVAITDEACAVERAGLRPKLMQGRSDNIKITHPQDLPLAERILAAQAD